MYNKEISTLTDKASQNAELLLNELKITFNNCIIDSNEIIDSIKSSNFDVEKENKKLYEVMEKLLLNLNNYDQLNVEDNIDSVNKDLFIRYRRNMEINYRQLSNVYYKSMIDKVSKQAQQLKNDIKTAQSNNSKLKNDFNNLNGKIEGLGATFLNIVLTISICSTMITILTNVSPNFSLAIILGSAWLLLSSILFIGSYFKNEDSKKSHDKIPLIVYIILSILTVVAFIFGIFTNDRIDDKKKTIEKDNFIINSNQKGTI